jgi:hypothetical protein
MEQNVTIKIPGEWMDGLPREELALQQIFRLGVARYKVERAIQLYRDGVGSLGYIAEKMGLDKQSLIREARLHDLSPDFSEQTIREELAE